MPIRLRWRTRIVLTISGVVIGILLAELLLRLIGISFPAFGRKDADLGFSYVPGARGWWREEGEAYVRLNRLGYRGEDYPFEKPQDTFRIALVGDSFIAGFAVDEDSTVSAVLERELSRCPALAGKKVECMNFGSVGYGTAQELLVFRRDASRFSPDLVILAICVGNDIRNNSRALEGNYRPRPYFVLEDEALVLDDSFKRALTLSGARAQMKRTVSALVKYSRVMQLIRRSSHLIKYWARSKPAPVEAELPEEELGLDLQVYGSPPSSEWAEAWEVTEKLIVTFRDEVERSGATFLTATLCQSAQVRPPEERREFVDRLQGNLKDASLFYPERRIAALGDSDSVRVINLAYHFQEEADRHGLVFHGFERSNSYGRGHWNERGHRLAGVLFAEHICRLLLTASSP